MGDLAGTWLKLDIGILQDVKIRKIRRMPDGDTFFACWIGILCHAMEHGSDTLILAEGVPADVSDVALICDVDDDTAERALGVFAGLKMIERTEEGIVVTKFGQRQSLDNLNRKREQGRERQARYRGKKEAPAPVVSAPTAAPRPAPAAVVVPPPPAIPRPRAKRVDEIPHKDCVVFERAWDEAFREDDGNDGKEYDRSKSDLFRDRGKIGPLIQKHGIDEVVRRVRAYFALPAQYNTRTVTKFLDRWNAIDTAGGGRRQPAAKDYAGGWAENG